MVSFILLVLGFLVLVIGLIVLLAKGIRMDTWSYDMEYLWKDFNIKLKK